LCPLIESGANFLDCRPSESYTDRPVGSMSVAFCGLDLQ
jgi:hypothetical protein